MLFHLKPVRFLAQIISTIFHPIFLPLYTVWVYFYLSPRYFLPQNIRFMLYYLLIVSVLIPLLFFGVMYSAGLFENLQLKKTKERFFLSVIMTIVYIIIFNKIIHYHQYIELYPFFLGIILAVSVIGIYNFFQKKPSLHAMSIGGSWTFLSIWSYYTHTDILVFLSLFIILGSIIIASRLYLNAHNRNEILRGLAIGILMQLLAFVIAYQYL